MDGLEMVAVKRLQNREEKLEKNRNKKDWWSLAPILFVGCGDERDTMDRLEIELKNSQ